jgi:ABC-2 type transport system permease protein
MNIALNIIAMQTIVRKEVVRVLRIWVQTVVPPAITMTLYFIIFGNLIGRRIGTMDGFDYMQYIAPGLIMMSVITNSYGNVVSSFFGAKFGRHIEEMLVSPMSIITVSIVLLSSVVFSLAGFINAVFAKKFDDISIVPTFVLTPLTYLGGVFYSISMLPEFWQTVSLANPILYMVNAFRYGILGTSDINIGVAYGILLVFVVVLFAACVQLLNRGVGIRE